MKSKNQRFTQTRKQTKGFKWIRIALFSVAFVSCVAAADLGGFLPFEMFRAFAQLRQEQSKNDSQVDLKARNTEPLSENVRQQIAALVEEKINRSAARRKMDSRLIYSIMMERGQQIAPGVETLAVTLPRSAQDQPIIDIMARVDKKFIAKLKGLGAKILGSFPQYNTVRAEVGLDKMDTIADFPEVIYVQPMQEAMTQQNSAPAFETPDFDPENLRLTRPGFEERRENVTSELLKALGGFETNLYTVGVAGVRKSEGDTTEQAALTRNTYGFNGNGIKIGVLSDGVRNLAAAQQSGDIGPVTVLPGQSGTSAGQCAVTSACDEGTAMLEIVHDLAPGAQLYFATAFGHKGNRK